MENRELKILVTSRFIHPQLGGHEIHTKEFDVSEGLEAEKYYIRQIENEKGNEAFMFTQIDIVLKNIK